MHVRMINLAIRQGCVNNVYPCAEFHKFNCGNLATTLQSFSKVDTTYKFLWSVFKPGACEPQAGALLVC